MNNYLANLSYLALKKETTEGVAVIPDVFLPLESSDLVTNLNLSDDGRMMGNRWKTHKLFKGERTHEGNISVWGDPDTLGYILDMTMKKESTAGDGDVGYTHNFEPGNSNSYTIEIPRGDVCFRYFGVKGDELKFDFEEEKLKAELTVKCMGHFSASTLRDAVSSGTSIALKQDYDLEPARGLVVGDTLVLSPGTAEEEEVEISAIAADKITITVGSAITKSHAAGATVYLKAQTPTISATLQKPLFLGNALMGFGTTAALAETAASSKTTATPCWDISLDYKNNLFAAHGSHYLEPVKLLPQENELEVEVRKLFETADARQKYLDGIKQGVSLIVSGELIKTTPATTKNYLKINLHNAQIKELQNSLTKGEYIFDEQTFGACYDDSDGKAVTVVVCNKTATY